MKSTKEKLLQIRISEEELNKLKENSIANNLTVSEYTRLALFYMNKGELQQKATILQNALNSIGEIVKST